VSSQLPISYKEFLKNPIMAIFFMAIIGLTYMYRENKSAYKEIIKTYKEDKTKYEIRISFLERENRFKDSVIFAIATKIEVLTKNNKK
jgi:putative Mn2+ efflux pump MntP